MTEIEQLRADISTLEAAEGVFSRKYGQTYQRYNIELDKMRKQLVRLEVQADVLAISGIGELNQYLMGNGVGVVGDMTAKAALNHIKSLEAELSKRPVVWCVRSNISGNFYRLYDEPALFATANQARKCPGVPKEWIVESYTGE